MRGFDLSTDQIDTRQCVQQERNVKEAGGHPEVPHPSGPPDPVDVLVDGLGQVVVDHVLIR